MKTKITSALVFIVTLIALSACTEEQILPANSTGTTMVSDHAQPGSHEEVIN